MLTYLKICLAVLSLILCLAGGLAFSSSGVSEQDNLNTLTYPCSFVGTSFGFKSIGCRSDDDSVSVKKTSDGQEEISFVLAGWDGEPASSLYLASGEKSIVAAQATMMAMAILETGAGQTAPDGMPVDFFADGVLFSRGVTKGGVAFVFLEAPTRAGAIEIMARAEHINTKTNFIRIVPADPVALAVTRSDTANVVVSENEVWVKTEKLFDQYGNALSDGSLIQFSGVDDQGRGLLLNSIAINGTASAKVLNRNLTDTVRLNARHKDVVGEVTDLAFQAIQIDGQLEVKVRGSIGQLEVRIGPVLRKAGGFVPDGTLFKIITDDGLLYNSVTVDGIVVFRITHNPLGDETNFRISANGTTWSVSFERLDHDNLKIKRLEGVS